VTLNVPKNLTGLPAANCQIVGNGSDDLLAVLGGLLFLQGRLLTVVRWGGGTISAAETKKSWAFATIILHQTTTTVGGGAIAPCAGNFEERVARVVRRLYPPRKLAASETSALFQSLNDAIGEGQQLLPASFTYTATINNTRYEYNHVLAQCQ
jgi:hypothetical protein